jgi:hypothetical protein
MAIDSTDTLYFQQVQGQQQTFLLTRGGGVLVQSFNLYASRPRSEDMICGLVIDMDGVMHLRGAWLGAGGAL